MAQGAAPVARAALPQAAATRAPAWHLRPIRQGCQLYRRRRRQLRLATWAHQRLREAVDDDHRACQISLQRLRDVWVWVYVVAIVVVRCS